MSVSLPAARVGKPVRYKCLSVFPLFSCAAEEVDYRLSETALTDQSLLIEEVDKRGSVNDLLVENKGDVRVLLLEGEELRGAKQNRILNTSVLVAAHTKIKIPVSCVEQGRWRAESRFFRSSDSYCPSKLRRALKGSVSKSIEENRGHESDQQEVWREVACFHAAFEVESDTAAMLDVFDTHRERIIDYLDELQYVHNANGIAVAIGGKVVSVDIFDKPKTCQEVWNRMLMGVVFDAIEAGETERVASIADVERLIATAVDLSWSPTEAVGEGEEYRATSDDGDHVSALALGATVVHASVLAHA